MNSNHISSIISNECQIKCRSDLRHSSFTHRLNSLCWNVPIRRESMVLFGVLETHVYVNSHPLYNGKMVEKMYSNPIETNVLVSQLHCFLRLFRFFYSNQSALDVTSEDTVTSRKRRLPLQ